jgi:hypothetical protein
MGASMKTQILLLAEAGVGGYYAASLMERGYNVLIHGGGAPLFRHPGEFVETRKEYMGCAGCVLLTNDPEMLEIADHFADTGKPVWRELAEVPRSEALTPMGNDEPDLVDVFYRPHVRALGNLHIIFAQCEHALKDLVTEINGGDEEFAEKLLKNVNKDTCQKTILPLVQASGIEGYELTELSEALGGPYWDDREKRNRLIHDEWYVHIPMTDDEEVAPATRGRPRRKDAELVYESPTPEDIWSLARRFQGYNSLFDHAAYELNKKRPNPER